MVEIEVSAEAVCLMSVGSVVGVVGVAMVVWVSSERVAAVSRAMRRVELGGFAIGSGWWRAGGSCDVFVTFCMAFYW